MAYGYFGLRGDGHVNGLAFAARYPFDTFTGGEEPSGLPFSLTSRIACISSKESSESTFHCWICRLDVLSLVGSNLVFTSGPAWTPGIKDICLDHWSYCVQRRQVRMADE